MTTTVTDSAMPDITVTMVEDATTFEGLITVRRHDRPSPGDVAAYLRSVLGPAPEGAHVHVIAAADDFASMAQALGGYDIELSHESAGPGKEAASRDAAAPARGGRHALRRAEDNAWWEEEPIDITRPAEGGTASSRPRLSAHLWPGMAVCAAVILCAGAIWATLAALDSTGGTPTADTVGDSAAPESTAQPLPSAAGEASTSEQAPPAMVVSRGGLMVEVPAGFNVEPDGDMWRATGADPDFRLQLAVDPLYGLAAEDLLAEVLREIGQDPAVELLNNEATAITYRESAEDGSQVLWRTWVDGGHQLSVGCHTRSEPTTVHSATCRKAMESAAFNAEQAQG